MERSRWNVPSATEQVQGVSLDYFAGTKEGHQFHYSCLKKIADTGGEHKCPKCDETIRFQALDKRIQEMEKKRLAQEKSQKERMSLFEALTTQNRKSAVESEIDTEVTENIQLDPDRQSRHGDHFDQKEEKSSKCCSTVA